MWAKPYDTTLEETGESPALYARATHDGYMDELSVVHTRKAEWLTQHQLQIHDSFSATRRVPIRGAFHLGHCHSVAHEEGVIKADFGDFELSLSFPAHFSLYVYYGSKDPFMGWRSTIYGKWEPIHSIVFVSELQRNDAYAIGLEIIEPR